MIYNLFRWRPKFTAPEDMEAQLNKTLTFRISQGLALSSIRAVDYDSDILFELQFNKESEKVTEQLVLTQMYTDHDMLQHLVHTLLSKVKHNQRVKALQTITFNESRMVAAFMVIQSKETEVLHGRETEETAGQNPGAPTKSDTGTKRSKQSGNRKSVKWTAEEDSNVLHEPVLSDAGPEAGNEQGRPKKRRKASDMERPSNVQQKRRGKSKDVSGNSSDKSVPPTDQEGSEQ